MHGVYTSGTQPRHEKEKTRHLSLYVRFFIYFCIDEQKQDNYMKKLLFIMMAVALLSSCQESLEDRAYRETLEYNKKFCPMRVDATSVLDSIVFDKTTKTKCSYFTLEGVADNLQNAQAKSAALREVLVTDIKNSPNEIKFKEAGFSYRFVYRSASDKNVVLFQTTITKEDYQ
jgi:hypothetical protein